MNNNTPASSKYQRRRTLSGNKNSLLTKGSDVIENASSRQQANDVRDRRRSTQSDTFNLRTASVFFFVAFIWHSTLLPSFYKMAGPEIAAKIQLSGMHVDAFKDPENLDPKILREFGFAAAASHTIVFLFGILCSTALRTVRFSSIVRSESGRAEPIGIGVSLVLVVWTASVFHVLAQAFARYAFETKFGPVYNYATIFYKTTGGESPFAWASSVSFTSALLLGFFLSSDINYARFEYLLLGPLRGTIGTTMASVMIPFMIWLGLIDYLLKPFISSYLSQTPLPDERTVLDAEHAFAFAVGLIMMTLGSTTKVIRDTCCGDDEVKETSDKRQGSDTVGEDEYGESDGDDYTNTLDWSNVIRTLKTLVATFTLSCTLLASALFKGEVAFDVVITTLWRPMILGAAMVLLSWLITFTYLRFSLTEFTLRLSKTNPIRIALSFSLLIVLWNVHMFFFFGCWVPFHAFSSFLSFTQLSTEPYTQTDAFFDGFLYAFTGPYFGPVLLQGSLKVVSSRLKMRWGLIQETIVATFVLVPPCFTVYFNWTKVSLPVHLFMSAAELIYLLTWRAKPEFSGWRDWPNLKRSRIWYLLEDYFNVRFIVEDADVDTARDMKGDDDWNPLKMVDRSKDTLKGFEPNKPRLLCFAPHGMFPCTVIWMHLIPLWGRVFKRLVPYALTDAFTQVVPGMREVMQWAGGREITKEVMQSMLNQGKSLIIVPGGQAEIFLHSNENYAEKKMSLCAKHRGFLRVGMEVGADFVPIISFGELDAIKNVNLPTIQAFFRKYFGAPVPFIPVGVWGMFPVPRRVNFTLVFGKAMNFEVKEVGKPTDEEVARAYVKYFTEIERLFETYKETAGYGDWELHLDGFSREKGIVREMSKKFY